jgi:DNA-binding winged helix-turn-helix (wHTH) protein
MEFDNLVTIKEKGYQINKGIQKRMKTHESKTCSLSTYHPATISVM